MHMHNRLAASTVVHVMRVPQCTDGAFHHYSLCDFRVYSYSELTSLTQHAVTLVFRCPAASAAGFPDHLTYLLTYLGWERVRRPIAGRGGPPRPPPRASVNLVPLLWTGVRHHPPGRTDKNLCRCFGAPACRVFPNHPDHLGIRTSAHIFIRALAAIGTLAAEGNALRAPGCRDGPT